jgi:7-carboxy-7-deazaguanine synthase
MSSPISTDALLAPTTSPVLSKTTPVAPLVEVFSAIQGEGANVGTRQIFVRFGGCDLRCHYCDSAHTWKPGSTCRIEQVPGERDFQTFANPISALTLTAWVKQLHQPNDLHDSISLTGGEPLLQAEFLKAWLPELRAQVVLPIYLETGGHLPDALAQVLPHLNSIGMDLKLPSVSGETHWSAHANFLHTCYQAGVEVFCKVIVSAQTELDDLRQAAQLIAGVSSQIPLFLQPVTPLSESSSVQAPTPAQVLAWQAFTKQFLSSVRVVPQTHKMIQQL